MKKYSLNQIISTLSIHYKDPLTDFTLSNARRFYSSKGDPLVVKGLKTIFFNPFTTKTHLKILLCLTPDDLTLSDARRFYSSKGDPLVVKGLKNYLL